MQLTKWAWALGMTTTVLAGQVQAADQGHGKVTFTGAILDAPCLITPDTIEQTVDLDEISNKALANGGKFTACGWWVTTRSCVWVRTRLRCVSNWIIFDEARF